MEGETQEENKGGCKYLKTLVAILVIVCLGLAYMVFVRLPAEHAADLATGLAQNNVTDNNTQPDIQLVLINPAGCPEEACNDFSIEAQEYADLLNIKFNRVSYPDTTQIPALYLMTDGEMSLITAIEAKAQIGEYVCLVTRSQRACEKSGLLNTAENVSNE